MDTEVWKFVDKYAQANESKCRWLIWGFWKTYYGLKTVLKFQFCLTLIRKWNEKPVNSFQDHKPQTIKYFTLQIPTSVDVKICATVQVFAIDVLCTVF